MSNGQDQVGPPIVDWRFKGFPVSGDLAIPVHDLAQQRWNVINGDLLLPLMLLKRSAVTHNIATMAEYCRHHGVELAPHAKTSMAPALLREQQAAGAWGFTIANTSQAIVLRTLGFNRLLLASQMVEPRAIEWAAEQLEDPEFDLLVLVDSIDAVRIMDTTLRAIGGRRPLRLLVEFGQWGGRTGCRSPEQVEAVIAAIQATSTLELAGVEGFEGLIAAESPEQVSIAVSEFLVTVRGLVERLAASGAFDRLDSVIVSAGGSAYFDLVVEHLTNFDIGRPVRTILRSGCYVTHDHEMYELTSPLAARGDGSARLEPAFEVWSAVWSRPEPTLAVLGMGKRDVPSDYALPHPLRVVSRDGSERDVAATYRVTALNDQHAYVQIPADDPIRPGDRVVFGISHPCAAFDRWRLIPMIDDDYNVIDAIETYF
jgi:D-serine dehydratase